MDEQPSQLMDSRRYCPECEYNLTGATGQTCPWCGSPIDTDGLSRTAHGAHARRIGAMLVCLVFGVGSLVSLFSLAWKGLPTFGIRDGLAVISVTAAALGHLFIAFLTATGRRRWPMRHDDARTVLRYIGWLCVVLAVISATRLLRVRVVQGVAATNVVDFGLAALLYSFPGWTLLMMCMLVFRHDRPGAGRRHAAAGAPGPPFTIDSTISCRPDQIVQSWSPEPRPTTPTIEAAIDRLWEAESALAAEQGRRLFDGSLVRVQSVREVDGALSFVFGPTTYRAFFGTNLHGAPPGSASGAGYLANPLGVSAVVVTCDGWLIFGRRSDRVAFHAGYVHTIGGMLDEQDRGAHDRFDLFGCIKREVCEELGVTPDHVHDVRHTDLVRDTEIHQPELLFDVAILDDRSGVADRFVPSMSDGEHSELVFVPDDPDAVSTFLQQVEAMAPVAQAALLFHGRRAWGADWYERVCTVLYGRVPAAGNFTA